MSTITKLGKSRLLKTARYLEKTRIRNFNMMDFGACLIFQLPKIFPGHWKYMEEKMGDGSLRKRAILKKEHDTHDIYNDVCNYFGVKYVSAIPLFAGKSDITPKRQAKIIRQFISESVIA